MKRRYTLFSLLSILPFFCFSQTYHLSVSTAPYVNLSGGSPAVTGTWDDPEYSVPIGFTFQFFDNTLNTVYQLPYIRYSILANGSLSDTLGFFLVFGADLIDRGFGVSNPQSPITYKTTGSNGHHVFTMEWKNAGFYGQYHNAGSTSDFVNFQMELHEDSGNIVYHFGPSSVTQPDLDYDSTGAYTGLLERLKLTTEESLGEALLLYGDPSAPSTVPDYEDVYLDGTIPANTVYTFSTQVSAVDDPVVNTDQPYFVPNPSTDFIKANTWAETEIVPPVYVYNSTGSLIKKDDQLQTIVTSDLPSGIYQLMFRTKDGMTAQRIAVMH